jgi:hypothetical protein
MTTPSWIFLVTRCVIYLGACAAFVFGLVDHEGLSVLTEWSDGLVVGGLATAVGASGIQAIKGRPRSE